MVKIPERSKEKAGYTTAQINPTQASKPLDAAQNVARELQNEAKRQSSIHLSEMQQHLAEAQSVVQEQAKMAEAEYLTNTQIKFQTQAQELYDKAKAGISGNGVGFSSQITGEVNKLAENVLSSAPNQKAALKARGMLSGFQLSLAKNSLAYEKDYFRKYTLNETDKTLDSLKNSIRKDPDNFPMYEAQAYSLIESLQGVGLNELSRDKLIESTRNDLVSTYLNGQIDMNPTPALDALLNDQYKFLPSDTQATLIKKAKTQINKINKAQLEEVELQQHFDNADGKGLWTGDAKDKKALDIRYNQGVGKLTTDQDGNKNPLDVINFTKNFLETSPDIPKTLENQISAGLDSPNGDLKQMYSVILRDIMQDPTQAEKTTPALRKKGLEADLYLRFRDSGMDHQQANDRIVEYRKQEPELKVFQKEVNTKESADKIKGALDLGEDIDLPEDAQQIFLDAATDAYLDVKHPEAAVQAGIDAVQSTYSTTDYHGYTEIRSDLPSQKMKSYQNLFKDDRLNMRFFKEIDRAADVIQESFLPTAEAYSNKADLGLDLTDSRNIIQTGEKTFAKVDYEWDNASNQYRLKLKSLKTIENEDGTLELLKDKSGAPLIGTEEKDLGLFKFEPLEADERQTLQDKQAEQQAIVTHIKGGIDGLNKVFDQGFVKSSLPGAVKMGLKYLFNDVTGEEEDGDQ